MAVLQFVSPLLFMSILFIVQTFVDQSFQSTAAAAHSMKERGGGER